MIAGIAREAGILTTAIVTRPFAFEGLARAQKAEEGGLLVGEGRHGRRS